MDTLQSNYTDDSPSQPQSETLDSSNHPPPTTAAAEDDTQSSTTTTTLPRRRSRWDPPPPSETPTTDGRKRKSRWADDDPKPVIHLPDFMKDLASYDPDVQALNGRLLDINRKLQSNAPLDDRPDAARSPSPEPIYGSNGVRINTREYRAREKLHRERQEILSEMIRRNPSFKPPADYRPPKLHRKLYIPMKEYPGYNFIGLIIGPRGNTQKRMEKETGAKIVIRGKGSIKEGRLQQKRDLRHPDLAENEDLHVLVEADNQESLEAAAGMIEKLLHPVDEVLNEHKRQQLKELAALNGTIRDEEVCRLCGEAGHRQFACPSRLSTFKSDVLCKICGDGGHPTIDCPVKNTTGKKMDDEYQSFLAELGGTGPESLTKTSSATLALPGSLGSNPPWANGTNASNSATQAGLGSSVIKPKEIDETNLYIGYLPPTLEDEGLIGLFSAFGEIVMAKVIKDRVSGMSKGYGFVKYADVQQANNAINSMNGYKLDGRSIAVRVAGKPPQPVVPPGPPAPPMPTYLPPNQQHYNNGGHIGSMYPAAPVPWGQPPPPPYAPYPTPPPPPGSAAYPPQYGMQYPPPPMPPGSSGAATQTVSSTDAQQSYPPLSEAQQSYAYGNPVITAPYSYPPHYGAVPPPPPPAVPQPSVDPSQSFSNVPWASNPPAPPLASSAEKTDSEYEKFMAEMK